MTARGHLADLGMPVARPVSVVELVETWPGAGAVQLSLGRLARWFDRAVDRRRGEVGGAGAVAQVGVAIRAAPEDTPGSTME